MDGTSQIAVIVAIVAIISLLIIAKQEINENRRRQTGENSKKIYRLIYFGLLPLFLPILCGLVSLAIWLFMIVKVTTDPRPVTREMVLGMCVLFSLLYPMERLLRWIVRETKKEWQVIRLKKQLLEQED